MRSIVIDVTVDTPSETVWSVPTEFDRYGEWNPALSVEGTPEEGARLTVGPGPEAPDGSTVRPRVLRVVPGRELVWKGRLHVPGPFGGRHAFRIEALGDGRSRFVQSERFSGLPVGPILRRYGADTGRDFVATNEALKTRAEARAADEPQEAPGVGEGAISADGVATAARGPPGGPDPRTPGVGTAGRRRDWTAAGGTGQ